MDCTSCSHISGNDCVGLRRNHCAPHELLEICYRTPGNGTIVTSVQWSLWCNHAEYAVSIRLACACNNPFAHMTCAWHSLFQVKKYGRCRKRIAAVFHVAHVLLRHIATRFPQVFRLGRDHSSTAPLEVIIAVIESLALGDLKGLSIEKTQEGSHRHCGLSKLYWAVIVPEQEPLVLRDVPS